ncbi:hypothetical protein [Duganella sp. HH105]|uniref:hypothetical protein n=1 Tax=Duganella sp. HH105 TaxID=1781067 RepID=UPI000892AD70|nr:hypothetical protein [Duganella sp. HH105]OEZ54229.1 hypothetical protein DUGA6_58640 [Duganella sp. HH105]
MKFTVDHQAVTIIENTLAQSINGCLAKFVESELQLKYQPFFSRDCDQNFADLDRYCGDLVAKIGQTRAIVLEIKLKEGNQLPAFDEDQHRALSSLAKNKVPIHYCYNGFNFKVNRPTDISANSYLACEPLHLGGKLPLSHVHETLAQVVWKLIFSGKGGFDEAVYALAIADICGDPIFELSQMTAKCLLMLYNPDLKEICLLDQKMAEQLVRELRARCFFAPNKGSDEFTQKLEEFSEKIRQTLHVLKIPNPDLPSEDDTPRPSPSPW